MNQSTTNKAIRETKEHAALVPLFGGDVGAIIMGYIFRAEETATRNKLNKNITDLYIYWQSIREDDPEDEHPTFFSFWSRGEVWDVHWDGEGRWNYRKVLPMEAIEYDEEGHPAIYYEPKVRLLSKSAAEVPSRYEYVFGGFEGIKEFIKKTDAEYADLTACCYWNEKWEREREARGEKPNRQTHYAGPDTFFYDTDEDDE